MGFKYRNVEQHGGSVRRVVIRGGRGYKSVTRRKRTVRAPLTREEIRHIKNRKFIPGLFSNLT